VLGSIALILAFGSMVSKMLAESGGAERIASTIISWCGERNVHWAMLLIACLVGVPVFFRSGRAARADRVPDCERDEDAVDGGRGADARGLVRHARSRAAASGPMAAIGVLKADVGKTILYALAIGIPTAIVTGPLLAFRLARGLPVAPSGQVAAQFIERPARARALLASGSRSSRCCCPCCSCSSPPRWT
jgi:GntP family gluconate:H+ symporter